MRVLDNLENYDIPSGFHLTAEQEEQLAADLKEIVLALIPLRSSKLKTRQYFNSHLRYYYVNSSTCEKSGVMLADVTWTAGE